MEDIMLNIRYEKTTNPKAIPGEDNPLKFGTIFTDHMFIMNYEEGKGWFDPRVVPYQSLQMEPSSMVFHYGQEMFEGLKAYKAKDGRILLFRPDKMQSVQIIQTKEFVSRKSLMKILYRQ